jgi:hypothetical protein
VICKPKIKSKNGHDENKMEVRKMEKVKCENCLWYFPMQKICIKKGTCEPTPDNGLNTHSELTKVCDC